MAPAFLQLADVRLRLLEPPGKKSYAPKSYGLNSYGLYSYGLYSHGVYSEHPRKKKRAVVAEVWRARLVCPISRCFAQPRLRRGQCVGVAWQDQDPQPPPSDLS